MSCLALSSEIVRDEPCTNFSISDSTCERGYCRCSPGYLWQNGSCVSPTECNCFAFGKMHRYGRKKMRIKSISTNVERVKPFFDFFHIKLLAELIFAFFSAQNVCGVDCMFFVLVTSGFL